MNKTNKLRRWVASGILCLLFLPTASAIANEIPFPKTSYEAIDKANILPTQSDAALFVVMDETTGLSHHHKFVRKIQEITVDWLRPGRSVEVIRFSAYVPGRTAEIVTGGRVDPEPSKSFMNNLKRSQRGKFTKYHNQQIILCKEQTTKAIRSVFNASSTNIPKSEILYNVHRLTEHIREYKAKVKIILLVSDMLENSSVTSFYTAGSVRNINPDIEIKKANDDGLIGNFGENVIVYIAGLGYGSGDYLDSGRLNNIKSFWQTYFERSHATIGEIGTPMLYGNIE